MISLGCPKNLVDSEVMLGLLKEKGWVPTDRGRADVAIVNTCGFIRDAKEESIEAILAVARDKRKGKIGKLVVAGCLPQRYGGELAKEMPEVDLFIGTGEFHRIADLLSPLRPGEEREALATGAPEFLYDHRTPRVLTSPAGSAYIKVSEGCSNACSYCVIPRVRGALRSRTVSSVVKEVARAVSGGVKEINLLAQDLTAYGSERKDGTGLVRLLEELARVEGLRWIRMLYLNPSRVTKELLALVRKEEKILKYLDLPLQHIDPSVLGAMNRPELPKEGKDLVAWIRDEVPGVTLRTSLMVGFPGETEKKFQRLAEFVREAEFDHLGVFRYSREEGTPAACLRQVPENVKERRYNEIMTLQKGISLRRNRMKIGSRMLVLVEGRGRSSASLRGRTAGQAPEVDGITFLEKGPMKDLPEGGPPAGEMVEALITRATSYDLYGKILKPA
ncbi:MAG TPA: 30S ribosomal protein S12 methylthiotransferase RimO [Thermodesulfobacteriota bacterium]|nr:30S ribosomal protein S12 methylthiotransferase RimO [Thermodesulfobacteriota bacterium]